MPTAPRHRASPQQVALCVLLLAGVLAAAPAAAEEPLDRQAAAAMARAAAFFRSIAVHGGYAGIYSLDLKQRWGEATYQKAGPADIWVQPPGTPSVGEVYLRAYRLTGDRKHLAAAREVGRALAWTQRECGGWPYLADVSHLKPDDAKPTRRRGHATLDDRTSQGAIEFLMDLDRDLDEAWLTESVELGLRFLLKAQYPNGGWPQWFPLRGGYHDYCTFNDHAINDCIAVLLRAHRQYGKADLLAAARRGGDFIIASQLPAPQAGWAQQYDRELRPAWARSFEPPGVCSAVTARNIRTLIELHLYTGEEKYLKPIPAAMAWLEKSKLKDGVWARLYEVGTNRPIYGDRDGKVHYTLEEISQERRSGYAWQGGYGVEKAVSLFEEVKRLGAKRHLAGRSRPLTASEHAKESRRLEGKVRKAIGALDEKGRWVADKMIRCRDFVANFNVLCEYLEHVRAASGGR